MRSMHAFKLYECQTHAADEKEDARAAGVSATRLWAHPANATMLHA